MMIDAESVWIQLCMDDGKLVWLFDVWGESVDTPVFSGAGETLEAALESCLYGVRKLNE